MTRLCQHCKSAPITHPQVKYCSNKCYMDAKHIRERERMSERRSGNKGTKTANKILIPCIGPCGQPFYSHDRIYNRLCPSCIALLDKAVPCAGRYM